MELWSPIEDVKGIGPKTAATLNKNGIFSVRDLVYRLPRNYDDYQHAARIADLRPGRITIKARASDIRLSRKRRNLSLLEASLRDESGALSAAWFNQPYRAKQLDPDKEFYFSGPLRFAYGRYQLLNPSVAAAEGQDGTTATKIIPTYRSVYQLKSTYFAKYLSTLRPLIASLPDLVPNFQGRADALLAAHFPKTAQDAKNGRDYLAVEELFCLLLAARLNRNENQRLHTAAIRVDLPALKEFLKTLPFRLTTAQRRATWEIIQDLDSTVPMNRLLQGDVGSGKTLVAALAGFVAAKASFQVAFLAPTEVLAAQHAASLAKIFDGRIRLALLTGSTKHKAALKQRIKGGEVDFLIGTHALLTDDTTFSRLGLVIIDEQHRFGVEQRQKLLRKAKTLPHLLSMTATPIPRSLQLTIFGDLDVSVLDELPAGRLPITTKIISPNSTTQLWQSIEKELDKGRQAYYICKKIDDKGRSELSSVKREVQRIAKLLPNRRVALLHGRMPARAKDQVMSDFSAGKIQVLVSTTVVEVGVDVPNATVMVIADADQYGLSQLHQLRGRVGRGAYASFCYLINSTSDKPTRRLREIEASQDGFHLAEVDLDIRGPGEIYGSLQHGALDLRIASITDTKLVKKAERLVDDFIQRGYNMLEYKELSAAVRQYQQLTTLN